MRSVISMAMDRLTGMAEVRLANGALVRMPLGGATFDRSSRLVRVEYLPQLAVLRATTDAGDEVEYDLPDQAAGDPVSGRPVVYLDQNQWSAVSNAIHGDGRPAPHADVRAALRLAELAEQRLVVLPASGGHLFETGKRYDPDRRYRLGLTVALHSRGWQMRDPIQVRRDELHDMFRQRHADGTGLRTTAVFTLDPDVMFGVWRGRAAAPSEPANAQGEPPLPPDAEALSRALVSATVSIDVLLDADRIPPGEGATWHVANQRFSDWLDGEQRDAQQKRNCVDAFLLSDLQRDVAEEAWAAGSTPDQMSEWVLSGFGRGLSTLRSAAVFREAMHQRHLNRGTTWHPNDLTDLIYLSCAAAHGDVVVAEGHMGGIIRQALGRLGRPTPVFKKLRDAVPAVESLLGSRGSSRSG